MTIISALILAAEPTQEAIEQAVNAARQVNAMRIALITITALAAANLLLVILIVAGRKKKAQ